MTRLGLGALLVAAHALAFAGSARAGADGTELSDERVPPQAVPERPALLLELGEDFLAPGRLSRGLALPGGARWRPQLLVFGQFRSGLAWVGRGGEETAEWANRLDLFANLRLSGTERILLGLRPFGDRGHLTGHAFSSPAGEDAEGFREDANLRVERLFFEGDFGEMFPKLDRHDRRALDIGFSVGRQPLTLQDGFLLSDIIDSLGVTKNSLRPGGASNFRVTGLVGWDEIDRPVPGGVDQDHSALLVGLSTATDLPSTTLEIDILHLAASRETGAGFFAGVGATQRLGRLATTFRVLSSMPKDEEKKTMGEGMLVVAEASWTPRGTHDVGYVNVFGAAGHFTSAARDPLAGGALGRVGILFESPGLGRVGSALSSAATDVAGFAVGRQWILADGRRQVVLELGGRHDLDGDDDALAVGARFQQALGRRFIAQLDGFAAARRGHAPAFGARCEILLKF